MSDLDDLAAAAAQSKGVAGPVQSRSGNLERIWTVHDQGRQFGPHTEHEIGMMVGSGVISADALVWRDGSPRWIPVNNIVPTTRRPLPLPQSAAPANAGQVIVNISNANTNAGWGPAWIPAMPGNGFGTASLVLGIIAVVLVCLPFLSIPLALIGLVLGIVGIVTGHANKRPTGTSIAGCVLNGLVTLFAILIAIGIVGSMAAGR